MGVITLALVAHHDISAHTFAVSLWVKLSCGVAIAAGTYIGGWRIINTMGNRLTSIESSQGFAAESASASVILSSSYFGYPLSTTHVVSGGVIGSGLGKRLASVRWGTAGRCSARGCSRFPPRGWWGRCLTALEADRRQQRRTRDRGAILAAAAGPLYVLARRTPIGAKDLDRTHVSPEEEARAGAPAAVAAA